MGIFTRWYNDPRLTDIRYLSGCMAPGGWTAPRWLSYTVLRRLAHLIAKLESRPCYTYTCSAAKWYLQHLDHAPIPREVQWAVDELVKRLRKDIKEYELETLTNCDPRVFGRMVDLVYDDPAAIIYGPTMIDQITGFGPSHATPSGRLTDYISDYCWPSSTWGR